MKEKDEAKNDQHLLTGISYAYLKEFIDMFDLIIEKSDEEKEKYTIVGFNEEELKDFAKTHTLKKFDELGHSSQNDSMVSTTSNTAEKHPPMRCKYAPDIYSATFFSLTNEYKWKYKFTDAEISSFLTESYAILFIQMLLTFMILFQSKKK